MGGISELCKIFPIAAVRNVTVMPHTFYYGPGLLAAIHATAALGTADSMIEWRCFDLEAQLYVYHGRRTDAVITCASRGIAAALVKTYCDQSDREVPASRSITRVHRQNIWDGRRRDLVSLI